MLESAAMPKTKRVTITVERGLLDELKQVAGDEVRLSALCAQAFRDEIRRLRGIALLEEWERERPISPEDRAAGEALWQAIKSAAIK